MTHPRHFHLFGKDYDPLIAAETSLIVVAGRLASSRELTPFLWALALWWRLALMGSNNQSLKRRLSFGKFQTHFRISRAILLPALINFYPQEQMNFAIHHLRQFFAGGLADLF